MSANAWSWRRRNVRAEARARRWARTADWDESDRFITATLAALPVMTTAPAGFHFEPPYGELVRNDWPHEWDGGSYWWGKSSEEIEAARAALVSAWESILRRERGA